MAATHETVLTRNAVRDDVRIDFSSADTFSSCVFAMPLITSWNRTPST